MVTDTNQTTPPRSSRLSAWTVLTRQSDYLMDLADTWKYGEPRNGDAATAARTKASELREVADWLREVNGDV